MGVKCGKIEDSEDSEDINFIKNDSCNIQQSTNFGICKDCQSLNTDIYKNFGWCHLCNSKRFENEFVKWTSCNKVIDSFIQETQLNANSYHRILEWIPYDAIVDVEYIGRGCYGTVFSATWKQGNILYWNKGRKKWARNSNMKVAVKCIDNSVNITSEFFNELRAYLQCDFELRGMIQYYGITRDPQTNDYLIVSEFANNGNLRSFLRHNHHLLNWEKRLCLLLKISMALQDIHSGEFIHRNLHSGNILRNNDDIKISDFGLSRYVKDNIGIYGVLPYVAPEILHGKPHTKASDVYSLAIIMCEVATGIPPFSNKAHDYDLAIGICDGIRPPFTEGTPKAFTTLVERCWDSDSTNRPEVQQITEMLFRWHFSLEQERSTDVCDTFRNSDINVNSRQQHRDRLTWRFHPQSCYTSRLLNFSNLPEPTNFFTRYCYDSAFGSTQNSFSPYANENLDEDIYSPPSPQIELEQLRTPSMALSDPIYTSLLRKHFRGDKIFFNESELSSDNESVYSQEMSPDFSDAASLRYSKAITTELERRSTPDIGGKASRYSLALVAELQRCTTLEGLNGQNQKVKPQNYLSTRGALLNDTRNMVMYNKRHKKNTYNRYDQNASSKGRKEMVQNYHNSTSHKYLMKPTEKTGIQPPSPQRPKEILLQDDVIAYQNFENGKFEKIEENVDLENIDVLQFVRRQPTIQRTRKAKTNSIFVSKFDHKTVSTNSTPIPPIRV